MHMKRHATRIIPAALAAVLVLGACGGTDDDAAPDPPADTSEAADGDLRAPTPIEFTAGGSGSSADARVASAEGALAADDMMIAPYFDIEYVLGEGLVAPTNDLGYVYDATGEVTAEQVAQLAVALGVEGEPVLIDEGYGRSWRVGPEDGTAPSLWVSDDAQQWWNYNSAWADQDVAVREACAVSVDSEGNETIEDCPEPEPPVGVPTAEQAEQRARELLTALGVDPATVELETFADEWFASVTANDTTDARLAINSWNFGFGAEGVLQYAGGSLATPQPVGPYPLVDIATAFERLQDQSWAGLMARGLDTPMLAEDSVATSDIAVAEPAPVESLPGDVAVDPMPVDPPVDGSIPEMETVTVTLVDVQADLWWAWDVDGTVWLLPAYRFIGDDGGWYTVPAVTDEYLIQVDPPVIDEPIPVEPDEGTGTSEPGVEPDGTVPVPPSDELAPYVGSSLDDFTAQAERNGWTVRVVERDGESLAVTDDYIDTRVNVAVVTVDGVEQVVRATLDDGRIIAEATQPVEPTTNPTSVPITDVVEGVAFYPACGNEQLDALGTTWYPYQGFGLDEIAGELLAADREPSPLAKSPVGFARVAEPGPGDDIGTLVVWADGLGEFVSDSGDLSAILVDGRLLDEVPNEMWVC